MHRSLVHWWLFQTTSFDESTQEFSQILIPLLILMLLMLSLIPKLFKVKMTTTRTRRQKSLKPFVEYLHTAKSIEDADLRKIRFNCENIPNDFGPAETTCFYCNVPLVPGKVCRRPRLVCEDQEPIVTGFMTSTCVCSECGCSYRYHDWKHGVFNFNNHTLVTIPLLLHIRSMLSTDTAITRTISGLQEKLDIELNTAELENAYLAFEALVRHEYDFSCVRFGHPPKILI